MIEIRNKIQSLKINSDNLNWIWKKLKNSILSLIVDLKSMF